VVLGETDALGVALGELLVLGDAVILGEEDTLSLGCELGIAVCVGSALGMLLLKVGSELGQQVVTVLHQPTLMEVNFAKAHSSGGTIPVKLLLSNKEPR
jgi:hypothetical protein